MNYNFLKQIVRNEIVLEENEESEKHCSQNVSEKQDAR